MMKTSLMIFLVMAVAVTSQATLHDVAIMDFAFDPADLTVNPGDTVRWTNYDSVPHTSTSDSGIWDSGALNNGDSYSRAFPDLGNFPYHCTIHPTMTASVTVEEPGPPAQWEEIASGTVVALNDVFFASPDTGWIAADTGILRTFNGGASWTLMPTTEDMSAVHFLDSNEGWTCGNNGFIMHTINSGLNWTRQVTTFADKLRDIRMADGLNGWAAGRDGTILHTSDGGSQWNFQTNPAVDDLRGIEVMSNSEAWVCGSDGVILHTTDAGQNWALVTSGTSEELEAIFFLDQSNAWACGGTGVLLKSTDNGNTWLPRITNTGQDLNDVFFVDADEGWLVGLGGVLLHSTDGGANWEAVDPGISPDWNSIYFVEPDLGYAVGSGGKIIKYSSPTTGIDDQDYANVPETFSLGANYPNPFNPATKIPFSITNEAYVSLEIFDLTGRSLGKIFDGKAGSGEHTVYWNAEGLATGVYFYRLSVDTRTQTRRMLYLK
jgi:photosystem II stability/assembly factor-like uncharacterized protein